MSKKTFMVLLVICILCSVTGCKNKVQVLKIDDVEKETLLFCGNGKVQSGSSEKLDKYYYEEEDLKRFIKDNIAEFNEVWGKNSVELTKFRVEKENTEKVAKAILTYDNLEAYCALNGVDVKCYSMSEAKEAGVLPAKFTVAVDGSRTDQNEVTQKEDYQVLVIKTTADVVLPETVKYYSDAILLSSNTVETTEDKVAVIVYK